ncbi:PH-like domain-containing protein [Gordonia aurantiaca]|uniref:PH-like domain-containing protein n=1 Tax=Gordonia sp. B21 TaxID=3151852 RepID=UPI00326555E7
MSVESRRGMVPGILILLVAASLFTTWLGYGKVVFNAWFIGVFALIFAGLLAMFYLLIRGPKTKAAAQADLIGELPRVPADLGAELRGPDTGLYVGSTVAPSWQNRVVVGDISDRAAATITEFAAGILIARQGASDIWIPRESIIQVRTDRGLAGKVMGADGLLVIRWVLPTGTAIDSGLRADDKTIYPGWVDAFAGQHDSGQGTQE